MWVAAQPNGAVLIPACLVPLLIAIHGQKPRHALALGWLAGTLGYSLIGLGTYNSLTGYYHLQPTALVPLVAFLALSVGAPLGLFCAFMARLGTSSAAWMRLLAGAAGLALIDTVVAQLWIPCRITQLSATSWRHPLWLQTADLVGTAGPMFAIAVANIGVAQLLVAARSAGSTPRHAALATPPILILALVAAYGLVRQQAFGESPVAPLKVVCGDHRFPLQAPIESVTRNADLLVLPEVFVDLTDAAQADWLSDVVAKRSPAAGSVLIGVRRYPEARRPANSALLVSGDGLSWYDKRRLFPFTESYPLGRFDLLGCRRAGHPAFIKGAPNQALLCPAQRAVSTLICVELLQPDLVAADVRRGAGAIVALSNEEAVPSRSLANAVVGQCVLRAIESRRPLVRADRSGRSLAVTAGGTLTTKKPGRSAADMLSVEVAPEHRLTVYARTEPLQSAGAKVCVVLVTLACLSPRLSFARRRVSRFTGLERLWSHDEPPRPLEDS